MPNILVVNKHGQNDYKTIQEAIDKALPGDTVRVRNGIYNESINIRNSGTRAKPITIEAFPGHKPVIVPGMKTAHRVEFNAEWIIFQGFEIKNGGDGIKVYKPNNTIRNNYIHDNEFQGILVVSTDNTLIEGNTIRNNGTCPGCCSNPEWGGTSPKHCHGIYLSDFKCKGVNNTTIRKNRISGHGGRGIQWNGAECSNTMKNTLVDENTIENNSWGMAMYYNVEGAIIRNNRFINNTRPKTDDKTWTFIGIWGSQNNTIVENEFSSTLDDFSPLQVFDRTSSKNMVDRNVWQSIDQSWKWNGLSRKNFAKEYQKITGWDKNGTVNRRNQK